LDVIFTIVSRNYRAQAATLMQSLAAAEPAARRVVVATDGPIPELEPLAEVVSAAELGAPLAAMSVYYDALELNTAVKPFVFRSLLARDGVGSVTYLDPDIVVFRPLAPVREALSAAELALTPHTTRPLLGDAAPNDEDIARSGRFNLGFMAARRSSEVAKLLDWWAERCRFDCRVDLEAGLFTDQKWMDAAPDLVPATAILTTPALNLAYWNLEGRSLSHGADGWSVDGEPLVFFHYSGFDPRRPRTLSKHQNRLAVAAGSPLAVLLKAYAGRLLANGHGEASRIPYAHDRFADGRPVTPLMRHAALRAARAGEAFDDGLSERVSAWMDAPDPELTELTRIAAQAGRETAAGWHFDLASEEGRAGLRQWCADNAAALRLDERALTALHRIPSAGQPAINLRFAGRPDDLLAWRLGPEALAGRFDAQRLDAPTLERLAARPDILATAARFAMVEARPLPLKLAFAPGFDVGPRARWPASILAGLQSPHLERARGYPMPIVSLFEAIWRSRRDLRQLYPLATWTGRFRYLRWLLAGGLAEYGVRPAALPGRVRNHPLMRLAALTVGTR
jgi:hypothetical protein